MWHFFLKNVEKNNKAVHLRLVLTYLFKNLFNTKKHLAWALKKIVHLIFCVFQTKLWLTQKTEDPKSNKGTLLSPHTQ